MGERRAGRRGHGELETEVMAAVVAAGAPVTVRDVQRAVDADLSYNAVHTILTRLSDKNLVECSHTGRGNAYLPAAAAAGVLAAQMDALLRRGPSRSAVLRSFLGTLSPQDEHELRQWLADRDEHPGG
jgi:predicted transcriptional regulator